MKSSQISLTTKLREYSVLMNHAVLKPVELTTLEAYLILKRLFGPPNAVGDEDKTQWCYELKVPGAYIEAYDWKLDSWSIAVYEEFGLKRQEALLGSKRPDSRDPDFGAKMAAAMKVGDRTLAENIGESFIQCLMTHRSHTRGFIKKILAKPHANIIQNPYALYRTNARTMLDALNITPQQEYEQSSTYLSLFLLLFAAIEGFINLIYELYLRPELREERVRQRLLRENLDIKLRLAPLYCSCFSVVSLDHRNDIFRKFQRLIEVRNDFVHANLTKAMSMPLVECDDMSFLFNEYSGDTGLEVPRNPDNLAREHINAVSATVDALVEFTLESMKPRPRRKFRSIMDEDFIKIQLEDG